MTADAEWTGFFDGLDGEQKPVEFPGSRPPKRPAPRRRKSETEKPQGWDTNPRTYLVNNREVVCFPIRALAAALNRKVPTMRAWESKGWLPNARVRSPRRDGVLGHRLYSRAFIEGCQTIAEELGLLDPGTDIGPTDFPQRARALMDELGS